MSVAKKLNLIAVDDYLAGELVSPVKHEYLGGVVYAMAGATNVHNLIASNVLIALGTRLRGKPCRAYNSDTKIRVTLSTQKRFYYPDVSVICRPNSPGASFQDEPVIIVEVISDSTRRIDDGEKRDAYFTIPSLAVLLLVEQRSARVLAYRRQGGEFVPEIYEGFEAVIPLDETGTALPLSEIFEAVEFLPDSPDPDDNLSIP